MTPWVLLAVGVSIAGFTWLSNFFYHLNTPVEKLNDFGQAEAQRVGFGIGFTFAVAIVCGYMGTTNPPAAIW